MSEAQIVARVARLLLNEPRFVVYGTNAGGRARVTGIEVLFPPYSVFDQDEQRECITGVATLFDAADSARAMSFYDH